MSPSVPLNRRVKGPGGAQGPKKRGGIRRFGTPLREPFGADDAVAKGTIPGFCKTAVMRFPVSAGSFQNRMGALWIKRDGDCHPVFGGNKARKLSVLLTRARREGKTHLLVLGHGASHTVLATAMLGRAMGFRTTAFLSPFPASSYRADIRREMERSGATLLQGGGFAFLLFRIRRLLWLESTHDFAIPVGATRQSTLDVFQDAVRDLARDIDSKKVPEPRGVVVPLASGGTALGLAMALESNGLASMVLAVPVAGGGLRPWLNLWRHALPLLVTRPGTAIRVLRRIRFLHGYRGLGYGKPMTVTPPIAEVPERDRLFLDPIYAVKAWAAAWHQACLGVHGPILFWHTGPSRLNGQSRGEEPATPPRSAGEEG